MIENLKTNEISTRGGTRPGSGRKPKLKAEARELFYSKLDERWENIIQMLDKWIKEGDKEILKFLIEQRIGKPPQALRLANESQEPLQINIIKYGEEKT